MDLYFVDATTEAYYNSQAFNRVISYTQARENIARCNFRSKNGKDSIVISDVASVREALAVLTSILAFS